MAKTLYERDFYAWTIQTVQALRAKAFNKVDIEHLTEELESMGASQKHALKSRLRVLLMHLLKWQYQPSYRSRSWENTIIAQRDDLKDLIQDNPSLKSKIDETLPKSYKLALLDFENETGIDPKKAEVPEVCRYGFDQVLDDAFYPE
ncbi:DUF29 domain-containing protein [Cysteiniphilum sp. QT6929]|uniref:DUF29 domain-containing protein n=1 Tax=Cysteiniphilum sp. QT6929 TaxID=2975055 RepID=UPI0024B38BCF|nr:DUF29 domain-containing protein [Cysteiniphilum sp. QT6929]WHN66329.1 DUF29 domain-containing protein [Cysteiniphilum sp. QT6929]